MIFLLMIKCSTTMCKYNLRSPEEDTLVTVLTSVIIRNTDLRGHTHTHHTQVHARHPTHAHTRALSLPLSPYTRGTQA